MKERLEAALHQACHVLKQSPSETPVINFAKPGMRADYVSNLPFILADTCQQTPMEIAKQLITAFPDIPLVQQVIIHGAGAIHFYLMPEARSTIIADVLQGKTPNLPDRTQSLDPVIQNTHTRLYKLLLQLREQLLDLDTALSRVSLLDDPHEIILMQTMTRCFWLSMHATDKPIWFEDSLKRLALQARDYLNEVDSLMQGARYCLLGAVCRLLGSVLSGQDA